MARKSQKEKQDPKANINIDGDITGDRIVIGNNNIVNFQEAVKSAYGLFTIPAPVVDFTGRTNELEKLKASFKDGIIITGVSGGGGVGKTELARKLAQEIASDYTDARMSIDLLGTSETPLSSEDAMRRLLEPLYPNQKLPDEPEQLKGLYKQIFASQKALLLLDNAANENQVRPLIPPKPSAAIITSRKHFSLTEFGLNPLRLDVLSPSESRDLLRNTSLKLKETINEELDALAKLCGHLPLALRVAASMLNDRDDWTINTLQKRLEDEQTRLKRLKRDGDFDLDVEATLSLSYNLLDDNLKQKFRQLGVFIAPFVQFSAQAVWDIEDETETDELLGKFSNLGLLNINILKIEENLNGELQCLYYFHDLTQLFAMNLLSLDKNEAFDAKIRHASHFLGWAEYADSLYKKGGDNISIALEQIYFIWSNLFFAFDNLKPNEKLNPRSQLADVWLSQFSGSFPYLFDMTLIPKEKVRLLHISLSAAQRIKNLHYEGFISASLGTIYRQIGDYKNAFAYLNSALSIAKDNNDENILGMALANIANAYVDTGNFDTALQMYTERILLARKYNDKRSESISTGNMGNLFLKSGDISEAIKCFEKQLSISREIGDIRGESGSLSNLGNAHLEMGELDLSLDYGLAALEVIRRINDPRLEGVILGNLGSIYHSLEKYNEAIRCYENALSISQKIEDKRNEGNWNGGIGLAYKKLGIFHKATLFINQAMTIHRQINDYQGEIRDLGNLGDIYMESNNSLKAFELYGHAREIAQSYNDKKSEGDVLISIGLLCKALGKRDMARTSFEDALAILRSIKNPNAQIAEENLVILDEDARLEEKLLTAAKGFIRAAFDISRNKQSQKELWFEQLSHTIIVYDKYPEIQSLAKVLRDVMIGVKNPDLSQLPEEFAKIVKEELKKKE